MNKTINLAELTEGKMMGEVDISAWEWETRYSWGHTAEVSVNYKTIARAKIRYYNRRWESYRFQSVLHMAIYNYVKAVTGIAPYAELCKRDQKPMKSAAAESRRLARIEHFHFAKTLYKRMTAAVDGTLEIKNTPEINTSAKIA